MEQTLLRSLSVFMGGFTLKAAEAVCACEGIDVLDGLAMLVNKSLVEAEIVGGEVYRYRLLETVRQYAQEKLDEAGESLQVRNHHLAYFLEVSKQVEKCMKSLSGLKLVQSLKVEFENFRAAKNWAYSLDDPIMVAQGLQLSSNLLYYWELLNLISEGLHWIKKGLVLVDEKVEKFIAVRAKAYGCATELTNLLDNNHESYQLAKQTIDLFRRCQDGDLVYLVIALNYYAWGIPYLKHERLSEVNDAESHAIRQEMTTLAERLGVPWGIWFAADYNGWDAITKQDYKELMIQAEKLRTISLGTDFEGIENYYLGVAATWQGDLPKAMDHYQKIIDFCRTIDFKILLGLGLLNLGDCAIKLQNGDKAWSCYYESKTIAREIGKKWLFTSALRKLAEISLSRGQYQQAAEHLREGLILAQDIDPDIIATECLFPLLRAAEGIVPSDKMACLLGFIDKHIHYLSTWKKGKAEYDQIATILQASLDPAVFQASLEIGRQMSREQLQAEALAMAQQVAEAGKPIRISG
jgi:tetratricopeptide (TPR) repeat protein